MKTHFNFWVVGRIFLSLIILGIISQSCGTKENIIPNKSIPVDSTVSIVQQETYINKTFISLLGRKPDSTELKAQLNLFNQDNCGYLSRITFIKKMTNDDAFYRQLGVILFRDLLQSVDTTTINQDIKIYEFDLKRTTNPETKIYLELAIVKAKRLISLTNDLQIGKITLNQAYQHCIESSVYDEINMGTENFVVSLFSNFLLRYPTVSELENAKKMVDGESGFLFGKTGRSKGDFINIFLGSTDFVEGQVRYYFRRFLLREPTSVESYQNSIKFLANPDFKTHYHEIMTKDEFVRSK